MSERRVTVLPEHVANRIAAGEVVQRPSSVVKELLENSIDAGAASIVLSVREGGSALIQVSDDGRGMDEQDARASFLRHATSKIAAYEDLESVATFGFRGEALASIAAVARVSMKTRRQADEAAVVVKIDGGGPPRVEREAREPGTTVTVQNLFFNVPARRKFLKSPATEFRHVYEEVQRIALSRPSIALHFVNDDETVFRLKPAPLETRLADVLGQRRCEGLLPVEETGERITVHGYIGKPAFGMRTRQGQFLFLNGRFILSRTINAAVFSAYEHLLVKGSFPFFLLFLEVDPHRVDTPRSSKRNLKTSSPSSASSPPWSAGRSPQCPPSPRLRSHRRESNRAPLPPGLPPASTRGPGTPAGRPGRSRNAPASIRGRERSSLSSLRTAWPSRGAGRITPWPRRDFPRGLISPLRSCSGRIQEEKEGGRRSSGSCTTSTSCRRSATG